MIPLAPDIADRRDNIVDCTIHGKQYGYHVCSHLFHGAPPILHEEPTSLEMGVCACFDCAESATPVLFKVTCQACVRYHVLRLHGDVCDLRDMARAHDEGFLAASWCFRNRHEPYATCPYRGELSHAWQMGWRLAVHLQNCGRLSSGCFPDSGSQDEALPKSAAAHA